MKLDPTGATLIRVDLWRGAYLLLTPSEYRAGLKRGKAARRREANEKRTRGAGNILEAIDDGQSKTLNPARPGKSPEGQKV